MWRCFFQHSNVVFLVPLSWGITGHPETVLQCGDISSHNSMSFSSFCRGTVLQCGNILLSTILCLLVPFVFGYHGTSWDCLTMWKYYLPTILCLLLPFVLGYHETFWDCFKVQRHLYTSSIQFLPWDTRNFSI